MLQKRMFKVISPMEKRDGSKWWMRMGTAYVNKDNSINVYLDAMPLNQKDGVTLQLRELTEDELRERSEKRSTYSSRGTLGNSTFGDSPRSSFGDSPRSSLGDSPRSLGQSSFTDPGLFGQPPQPSSASEHDTPF